MGEEQIMTSYVSGPIWQQMEDALNSTHDEGREVQMWWRDDDAISATPALDRLLSLRETLALPLLLAVIPAYTNEKLFLRLKTEDEVWLGTHGFAHENHAPASEKKQELGPHRPLEAVLLELSEGREKLAREAGDQLLPVLIPPWNRIDAALIPALPTAGLTCLSTYGSPPAERGAVKWLNTHLDPIDWRGSRSLADPEALIHQFCGYIAKGEQPIGFLTHHLVHDEAIWAFTEDFLARLAAHPFVSWPPVPVLAGLA